jgi:hypothetical protein
MPPRVLILGEPQHRASLAELLDAVDDLELTECDPTLVTA